MDDKKFALVAKVLEDNYKLIINKGSNDSIKMGELVLVYEIGEEILDPETGISLGKVELVKGRGKVIHVQENMATIESIEKEYQIVRLNPMYTAFSNKNKEQKETVYLPFDNPKVGDLVKKII